MVLRLPVTVRPVLVGLVPAVTATVRSGLGGVPQRVTTLGLACPLPVGFVGGGGGGKDVLHANVSFLPLLTGVPELHENCWNAVAPFWTPIVAPAPESPVAP